MQIVDQLWFILQLSLCRMHVQIRQHFSCVSECGFLTQLTGAVCVFLLPLQNEKPLGHSASRSSNISKVSKAHTNGKNLNEWCMAFLNHRERKERDKRQEGGSEVSCGGRQRLTGQIFMQWRESSWLITCSVHFLGVKLRLMPHRREKHNWHEWQYTVHSRSTVLL